ncbi:MAG: class I SAM-dependent methyltransferase [Planctomycetota bacterium]
MSEAADVRSGTEAKPTEKAKSSIWSDLRVIWHLIAHPVRGKTHAERLESFYGGQADDYDSFRARMLHGRDELIDMLQFPECGSWVDMGAGTGENVLRARDRTDTLSEIHLVDLSKSLLEVAEKQLGGAGITNAHFHLADATRFDLPSESVDVVSFSYSLTMIPDWFEAVRLAERILKPGGTIAVTDFYVSRKYPSEGHRRHGWLRRNFWTLWFAGDNVYLNGDHASMLHRRFEPQLFDERLGKVPYLPFVRAPYYLFVGTKPRTA